jgi:hypothetical protein
LLRQRQRDIDDFQLIFFSFPSNQILYLWIGSDFDEIKMKAARARSAAARQTKADNHRDLLNEQKWTEELIAKVAERDDRRKISKKIAIQ